MRSFKEFQEQIAALQQQAAAQGKAEVAAVIADICAKMDEYGIAVADIGGRSGLSAAKGAKVAPKYRHPRPGKPGRVGASNRAGWPTPSPRDKAWKSSRSNPVWSVAQ